ncbi:hypothetical protein [Paenibacillus oryzisoli]|uniref:Uncharacterized protein n=1 Tax=Paenibacillus oryzisoli TaxID=1850517 RepID=A0A197ZX96_9BACL|nr:hypothetical protein [Paenibacillus oryzisoli]OAS13789.1 hypothetical protein A8708_25465 [Paenibacillus oryzisoli]
MKTIYENYRGFKINKDNSTYNAIHADHIVFTQSPLSQILDSIDHYIEVMEGSDSQGDLSSFPQN